MSQPTGVHALVRRSHEERVLAVLRELGALSRAEIATRVQLSRTTVSEITNRLLERGAVIVVDTDATSREGSGRPAERLALDPASGQFMGIDFGQRRVNVAVADASHDVIASGTARYEESAAWDERVRRALDLIAALSAETGIHYGALHAIGIGVPGWGNRGAADDVGALFAREFGARTIVDNNVRFAGLAEALRGRPAAVNDLVYLRLSDGVGGALIIGGRLLRGSKGFAGELGHITADPDGLMCRCGKRGCVETIASVPAILAACRAAGIGVETLDDLAAAAAIAHPIVERVLREAGVIVGRALGTVAMTLNPTEIVLGGEITRAAPVLLEQIRATVTYELSWGLDTVPVVRAAELSDEGGALGALSAVFQESPLVPIYLDSADRDSALPNQMQRSIS